MATYKRFRAEPDVAGPLPLAVVLDGPRPGPAHPAADARWRELQRAIADATLGTAFDLRVGLLLESGPLADWQARRRAWLRQVFAGDLGDLDTLASAPGVEAREDGD
jgi:hypothetical protein